MTRTRKGSQPVRLFGGGSRSGSKQRNGLAALNSNRLETLKGNRKGQYSIRINSQWRICFEWPSEAPGPLNVEIVDYH